MDDEDRENFFWCMGCQTLVYIKRFHIGHAITIVDNEFMKKRGELTDRLGMATMNGPEHKQAVKQLMAEDLNRVMKTS